MFASAYISGVIYTMVSGNATITDVVGDRIERQYIPQIQAGSDTFLTYSMPSPSIDDGPLGSPVGSSDCTFEIAIYTKGSDPSGIVAAADAMNDLFEALDYDLVVGGAHHQITCRRLNELGDLPPELGIPYVRIGGTYVFTFVV